jgi:hypothetical protein
MAAGLRFVWLHHFSPEPGRPPRVRPGMDARQLQTDFARIGARLRVIPERRRAVASAVRLDVGDDRHGEIFDLRFNADTSPDLIAVDVRPERRHLLLLLREQPADRPHLSPVKSRFLCGHDERHWFVAGVPEAVAGVSSVRTAMDALKPAAVRLAEERAGVKPNDRHRRKNAAFLRQGEWFFLPAAGLVVDPLRVRRNEPLSRGGRSKPHTLEYAYRRGGTTVHVCREYPSGVEEVVYKRLRAERPETRRMSWRTMTRDPELYARGRVRHADHATIELHGWHRVVMNTEGQSAAMRHVVFLD